MRVLSALLDLLYPPKCPFCGRVLERGEEGWCALCQEELPWTREGEGRAVELCDGCLSPLWYRAGARAGVHRLKFRGGAVHARLFGLLMAQCLQDRWAQPVDQITWVPLRPSSRARRGYDQAELLARWVGEDLALPVGGADRPACGGGAGKVPGHRGPIPAAGGVRPPGQRPGGLSGAAGGGAGGEAAGAGG